MKKEDRRTTYTKQIIRETFMGLLQQKPIGKISVTEICAAAEISRSTFYLHYSDCYQILEELQNEFCDKLIEAIKPHAKNTPMDSMLDTHDIIRNNNDLYMILMRTEYPMHAFKKFITFGKKILIEQMFAGTTLSSEEQDWLADYIIGADFAYDQRVLAHDYNLQREKLIHEFIEAGLNHFKK
jgi:AcrR family transcriptional regulator